MLGGDRIVTEVATITNRADPTTAGTSTLFYYHPDHLQSTSYVTGADGSILQHDEYFPGGEVWFQEQKNNDARNTQPYLLARRSWTETGLYYFGARYNPKLSVWTAPDPILLVYMGEKVQGGLRRRNLQSVSYGSNDPGQSCGDPDGRKIWPEHPERGRAAMVGRRGRRNYPRRGMTIAMVQVTKAGTRSTRGPSTQSPIAEMAAIGVV